MLKQVKFELSAQKTQMCQSSSACESKSSDTDTVSLQSRREGDVAKGYQVGLLQTAHSWANAGVLLAMLGARVRLRVAFETINYLNDKLVREEKWLIIN